MDVQKSITIQAIDPRVIADGFERLEKMISELRTQPQNPAEPKEADELLTREKAAKFLNCSLVSLQNGVNRGELKSYRSGGKVLFKKSELLASLVPIKKGGAK